jgi:hypothetical protein
MGSSLLLLETRAADTENGLNSLRGTRPYSSTVSSDISTGEAPWLISAQIGEGAQVNGASMQQLHHRWSGSGQAGEGSMYSSNSLESTKSSSMKSSWTSAPNTAATIGVVHALKVALACEACMAMTFLQASKVGLLFGHVREKWPA